MFRQFALAAILTIAFFSTSFGQSYHKSFGLRIGSQNGITLKHSIAQQFYTEGILAYHQGGIQLIGLVGVQTELGYRTGFFLVAGIGGHAGYRELIDKETTPTPTLGADVQLGVEYQLNSSPVILGFDIKPQLEVIDGLQVSGNQAGASIRFRID